MSQHSGSQYLTEIQTLSLLPDVNISNWSSEARKALQSGLRTTASNSKCIGVYWLKKREDADQIMIISKWTDSVDFTASRSYLRYLLPFLKSPPPRGIHVNHSPHAFSSYSITNFFTIYFPIRQCSAKFKEKIEANVNSFISATEYTYNSPDSLRFVDSGWIKETKMIGREVASGFIFCLMWTDKKIERQYKCENGHWRVLMRYLKAMGMMGEEQFHGKVFEVLGEGSKERFEFSDDSSEDDDDLEEQLESIREPLSKLPPCDRIAPTADSILFHAPSPARTSPEVARLWNGPELFNNPRPKDGSTTDSSSIAPWWEHEVEKTRVEESDEESPDSTPLLTPSSSKMSLNSLFDDSKSMNELPGTWKSEYDISRAHEEVLGGAFLADNCRHLNDYEDTQPMLPNVKDWYESSTKDDDEPREMSPAALKEVSARLRALASPSSTSLHQCPSHGAEKPQEMLQLDTSRRNENIEDDKAIPELMRRYGVPKWDAEEELQNAKSRFWRRRKRSVAPRLETQRATLRGRSPTKRTFPIEPTLSIDPLRNTPVEESRRGSWWGYLRECLPSPAIGSTASSDVGASVDIQRGAMKETGEHDETTFGNTSHVALCTLGADDKPLSVQQMERAKARLARIR